MVDPVPRDDGTGRRAGTAGDGVDNGHGAPVWGQPSHDPQYSSRQHQALLKAGQLIVEWAVEVARYEADLDWQWVHRRDDDPAVAARALARLIHDARSVVERAEGLLRAALPEDER
jgi:hypothetical protein